MKRSTQRLNSLLDELDAAYRSLRALVIDQVSPGMPLDAQPLSVTQRLVLDRFNRAERDLADYRAAVHDSLAADRE
jgi:hypothetical protein